MAHGTPDFQQTSGVSTVYQLTDMAELAARLGSIVTFDRRGDVFHLNDFEHGESGLGSSGSGTGSACYLSLAYARSGHFSLALIAGSNSDHYREVYSTLGLPSEKALGMEISFSGGSTAGGWELWFMPLAGGKSLYGAVKYDHTTDKLYYYDENEAWVELASGIALPVTVGRWNTVKLVLDCENQEYKRLLLNSRSYSMLDIPLYWVAASGYSQCYWEFHNNGQSGFNTPMYVDDLILTQNES